MKQKFWFCPATTADFSVSPGCAGSETCSVANKPVVIVSETHLGGGKQNIESSGPDDHTVTLLAMSGDIGSHGGRRDSCSMPKLEEPKESACRRQCTGPKGDPPYQRSVYPSVHLPSCNRGLADSPRLSGARTALTSWRNPSWLISTPSGAEPLGAVGRRGVHCARRRASLIGRLASAQ
ncbi:hypothetical protein BU16DRAFT_540648 [Lophium mytilinum]|uniref:Uncharacterized protein n=1 Tax=Lophium mytilinum TaxID=390894 RepID=A0A6A6QQY5_9PEZI|nr:hypothetical protein BU16DRAFT_540648 [Lophium mytilinum]